MRPVVAAVRILFLISTQRGLGLLLSDQLPKRQTDWLPAVPVYLFWGYQFRSVSIIITINKNITITGSLWRQNIGLVAWLK